MILNRNMFSAYRCSKQHYLKYLYLWNKIKYLYLCINALGTLFSIYVFSKFSLRSIYFIIKIIDLKCIFSQGLTQDLGHGRLSINVRFSFSPNLIYFYEVNFVWWDFPLIFQIKKIYQSLERMKLKILDQCLWVSVKMIGSHSLSYLMLWFHFPSHISPWICHSLSIITHCSVCLDSLLNFTPYSLEP